MHNLTVARRRPLQFVNCALDAMPDGPAVHVAGLAVMMAAEGIEPAAVGVPSGRG